MDISCGIFIIHQNNFLVGHATGSPWNKWTMPKGMIDSLETYEQAAIRETFEESNLVITTKLIPLSHQVYTNRNKTLVPFYTILGELPTNWSPVCTSMVKTGYPEIDKFKWLPISKDSLEFLHKTQQDALLELLKVHK